MFITIITQPTTQVSAITAVLGKAIAAVDSSVGTKKRLGKALKELNEDPVDLADALKEMKKARKKLNGKAAKEFKCPNEACDLIDEAIELLEKALKPF